MSLTSVPGLFIPNPIFGLSSIPSYTSLLIDASGEQVAFIFKIPKTGTISKVGFRTGTVTSSQTLSVALQTVSDTTGDPTGSNYGSSTAGTQASPASNTAYTVSLGSNATATKGDVVAIVIGFSGTIGNLNIVGMNQATSLPYTDHFTTAWAKQGSVCPIAWVEYNDGTYSYLPGAYPWSAINGHVYGNGSTPDEIALKFRFPVQVRLAGAAVFMQISGDLSIVLYDTDGTTALETVNFDANQYVGTFTRYVPFFFATQRTLTANSYYRISVKPTTATTITHLSFSYPAVATLDQEAGGQDFHYSQRTDAGAWSDTTTQRPAICTILDQIHSAGGLLRHPGMMGGIAA